MTTHRHSNTDDNGILITLEGIDGSGKSTARSRLEDRLPDAFPDVEFTFTREPTQDTFYGDAVYQSLNSEDADPLAELFLYTADHAAHLAETVRPALATGNVVISDRYSDSRCAYQAATLSEYTHLPVDDTLEWIYDLHQPWTRTPDLTVYLDISPETAVERAAGENKFEQRAYLEQVQSAYEALLDRDAARFVRVDAEQSPGVVQDAVVEAVASTITST